MREAEERRKDLERQHADTLRQLRLKQSEVQNPNAALSSASHGQPGGYGGGGGAGGAGPGPSQGPGGPVSMPMSGSLSGPTCAAPGPDRGSAMETIEALQSKIRELEKKTELQNVRHEELLLEMASIKRSGPAGSGSGSGPGPSGASGPIGGSAGPSGSGAPGASAAGSGCSSSGYSDPKGVSLDYRSYFGDSASTCSSPATDLTTRPHSPPTASTNAASNTASKAPASSVEIDRIMAKIEQDNRILAELDKTRSTIGTTVDSTRHQTISDALGLHSHPTVSTLPLTGMSTGLGTTLPLGMSQPSSLVQQMGFLPGGSLGLGLGRTLPGMSGNHQARMMPQIPGIPSIVTTQYDVDRGIIPGLDTQHLMGGGSTQGKVDMLDIPGKGRCYVYIARYSYDPFHQSPNDNPEAELAVNAGDYLLVWGTMDEDGFFDGELLDGRRGLVPSNFIQKLIGDDLLEFHQSVVLGLRDCDDCASTTLPQDLDFSMGHEYFDESMYGKRDYTYMDFDEMMDDEDEDPMGEGPDLFFSVLVPAPKQLTLERQLNKSVLIGWNHPDNCPPGAIDSYLLYVDGVLKATVKATERTRALVEGVDSNRPHRISVRSITPNRRTSRDAACTMVIGKDLPLGPTRVKASHVTSTSAVISWLPANSNHQHVVCVNNVELRTVKPGVYRHTITGLAPDTVYRVTVRAKNIRAPHFDEKHNLPMERYSCHIDFVTLPKGLPDPPAEIQVEPGPQDGTLLVTWLPVTANVTASSTNVTGYAVYADGKKVTDVDSPTGDHALIDIGKLLGLNPRQVTVRTKSRDAQSADSAPTPIPTSILRGKGHKDRMGPGQGPAGRYGPQQHGRHGVRRGTRMDQHGQMVIETEENLSDKEVYPGNSMSIPSIEITKDSASEAYSEEDYMGRRGHPGHAGHHGQYDQRPAPRSHAERGRPPLLPHERGRPVEQYDQYGRLIRNPGGQGPGGQGYRGGPMQQQGGQGQGGHQQGGAAAQRQQQNRVRWFVGLYDYDPSTMSPNPDGCVEELSFREGERIKVFGDRDADGFYWGEVRGRKGFIPENTVAEVTSPDAGMGGQGDPYYQRGDRVGDTYAASPVKKMVALYDYDPQELSPNVDADQVELTFRTGDIIYVYGEMDDDGFYMGELNGVRGLVPSNFLTPLKKHQEGDFRNGGPGPGPGRGGPMGPGMRPDRGHGPGARGPPPPPREGMPIARDRRQGTGGTPGGNEGERRAARERW